MYERILVPLDGSALAEKALSPAERLAKTFDAEVIFVPSRPYDAYLCRPGTETFYR